MKNNRQNSGITLIALIITVVVMLVLVGVAIATVINSNIINKANEAGEKFGEAQTQEGSIGEITAGGKKYASIEDYINGVEKIEPKATFNKEKNGGNWVDITPVTLSWEELKLEENGTKYGYYASSITDTSVGRSAFTGCRSLVSITIPPSVTSIGEAAFAGCESLKYVTLPGSIADIGNCAFSDCHLLSSLVIEDGVTYLPYGLFSFDTALTTVTIPASVTDIGHAFTFNENLTTIIFQGTKQQWRAITKGDELSPGKWISMCRGNWIISCCDGNITQGFATFNDNSSVCWSQLELYYSDYGYNCSDFATTIGRRRFEFSMVY